MTGYRGFFYHFLDMETGARFEDVELSTIDTTLLLGGRALLPERTSTATTPSRREIRAARRLALPARRLGLGHAAAARESRMGWTPEDGFHDYDWRGYNEAMILYVLALGSPTHPVAAGRLDAHGRETTSGARTTGRSTSTSRPLFGHQYSHVWIDFRGIRDAYMREQGHRLLRELAPRDARAARLRDRESGRLRGIRRRTSGD